MGAFEQKYGIRSDGEPNYEQKYGLSDEPVVAGNIDLHNRKRHDNGDGTYSTVRSKSFGIDGREVLLPTVSDSGDDLTNEQALDQYRRTGKHLGIFASPESATVYAKKLHDDQALEYGLHTTDALKDAMEQGNEELYAAMESGKPLTDAQRARMQGLESGEYERFGRVAKAAPRAIAAVTGEQFKQMVAGAKAMWKEGKAEEFRKYGPFRDSLDDSFREPDKEELDLGNLMSTELEQSAAKDIREARQAGNRAAAAIPAEATNFEKNVIQGAGSGLASAGVVLPSALLTPVTGGGAAIPGIMALAGGAAGARYAQLRDLSDDQDIDPQTARESATMLGALEGLTEFIPGATLVKKSPLGKKAVEFLLTDILGENISSIGQLVDDYRLQLRDDVTLDDLVQSIKDTTLQTVVGGAVQLGGSQLIEKGSELANKRAQDRANGQAQADINEGVDIPTGDEMAANLAASDAEQNVPLLPDSPPGETFVSGADGTRRETQTDKFNAGQSAEAQAGREQEGRENLQAGMDEAVAGDRRLPAPDYAESRNLADAQGNVRKETQTEAFHVERERERQAAARQRAASNLDQKVDRAMDVPRLPAPDNSGNPLVEDNGAVRRQTNNETLAAEQERARRRDLGMGPTRVPIDDSEKALHAALAAAKDKTATEKQGELLIANKLAKKNGSGTPILLPAGRRKLKALSEGTDREHQKTVETAIPPVVSSAPAPATEPDRAAGAAGTGGEDAALTPKHFDPRLEDQDRRDSVLGMAHLFGQDERGGKLLRKRAPWQADDGSEPLGDVIGKTPHSASEIWNDRPATEGGSQINYADATDALDRLKSGKKLKPTQERFLKYLLDEQDRFQAEFEEKQKAEAPQHRAEIIAAIPDFESQPVDAQALTERAKVAAQYATEDELEAALEAQDDGEAMRRLQRLIDRGWQQPQTVTGETDGQDSQQELAGDAEEGAGESVAPEASREAEVPDEEDAQDVGGSDERDADGNPVISQRTDDAPVEQEERDPTAVPDDARAPTDVLGHRQFENHSGIKLGDRVHMGTKHIGHVRRIFEIPGKTSKMGKKRTTETKVRAEVYWPTKNASESSEGAKGGSEQNVDIDKLKVVTDAEVETAAPGAKGMARKRLDKVIGKYLQAKRPAVATKGKERERIVSYRTEAVTGLNAAIKDGADQAVIDFLKAEFEWAKKTLTDVYPGINWETLEREKPKETSPQAGSEGDETSLQTGASDEETEEIAAEFEHASENEQSDDEQITHVFDAPTKTDIVRLNDKAKVHHKDHGWMSVADAKKRIEEWKAHAAAQGELDKNPNADKVVLSLFDLTGAWSQPWVDAGYNVWRFDIQDDPEGGDVNKFSTEFFNDWFGSFEGMDVYAILAACPCTDFAVSGARHFAAKDADGRTHSSVELVTQTLATIEYFKPAVWAIENPVGRIESLTGLPPWRLSFDPNHLGDPYTKKTLLWGRFNADLPIAPVEPTEGSKMHKLYGGKSQKTKNARSATPEGFSYGFFMANNAIDHPAMAISAKFDRLDRAGIEAAVKRGVTEKQITEAVEDFYYFSLDDKSANEAIAALQPKKPEPPADQIPAKVKAKKSTGGSKTVDDAGEKIGGARKDQWKERGLSLEDLESMTDSEAATIVKKAAIWKPDYEQMIAGGMEPKAAALVKVVFDKLAATPKNNTPEGRRHYIEMMRAVRAAYEGAKTEADVAAAQEPVLLAAGLLPHLRSMSYNNPERKVAITKLFSIMKGRSSVFGIGYDERRAADKLLAAGFPNAKPWTSRYSIREQSTSGLTPEGVKYYLEQAEKAGTPLTEEFLKKYGLFYVSAKGTGRTVGYAHTKEGAIAIAEKAYAEKKARKDEGELPDRPHLEGIERTGPKTREGDITPEDFLAAFGFRGVEFGNWAANDERQKLLNMAFDALHDLAEIVGVPAEAMSLNGTLGLALAARGSGKALAHYEPGKLVINMTKLRGAGTLAHEWGHALDHYFGELDRDDAYKTLARGASGWYSQARTDRANLRAEMQNAWHDVMVAIKGRSAYERSNYMKQAIRLSGKTGADGYWARPTELFARAFESYVFDKIKALGRESQYLVHGVEADRYASEKYKGNPYPTGEERVAIGAAFDRLVSTIEVVQADDKTMIREDAAEYGKVSEPAGTGSQMDLFVAKPALPANRRLFKALTKTNLVSVGKFQTGIIVARDFRDVAHMVAPLRKSPQEKFLAVVLNKDKEVLGILQHQIGYDSGAGVEIWSLVGAITKIPGAKHVYFAHNHPGGLPSQSGPDIIITNKLTTMLKGSGIESHGMVVVAPGNKTASYYSGEGEYQDIHEPIRATARPIKIDVSERRFARVPSSKPGVTLETGVTIDGPKMAKAAVSDAIKKGIKNGVLVLSYRHRVVDILDMSNEEMLKLRTGNPSTGMLKVLGTFESANSSNAMIFSDDKEAMQNINGLLNQAGVRVLDMFHIQSGGRLDSIFPEMRDGWFYAKGPREGTRMTRGAVESAIEPVLLNVNNMGIDVEVVSTPYHLPKHIYNELYDEGALELVKGIFVVDQGVSTIYMVASNIRSADHAREIVIHELAHYGIHNVMSAEDYEREMDRLWELIPEQVKTAARKNNIDISGPTGRRTAAEEVVAYASQRLIDGETLEVSERTWLKRIFDAVRNFLAKLWPKFAVADREIADILRGAMASLTNAQKQRAPEDRVFRKSESIDEPPKGEPVDLSHQNKLHLNINQIGRQWLKARVPTAWLMPQKPGHDFFQKKTAAEIEKFADANPPLLEWVQGPSGGFFEVIDGNHRVAAAKAAGVKEITVKYSIRPKGMTDNSWLFSREAPIFYSALLRATQDAKITKGDAGQWLGTLRNTPGVKQEEIEWTGLEEWIRELGRPATKQEVADFIAANQIKLEEVVMGAGNVSPTRKKVDALVVELTALGFTPYIDMGIHTYEVDGVDDRQGRRYVYDSDSDRFFHEDDRGDFKFIEGEAAKKLRELNNLVGETDEGALDENDEGTRYQDYTTAGGTAYREMLLTLPHKPFGAEQLRRRKEVFDQWQGRIDAAWEAAYATPSPETADAFEKARATEAMRDEEANTAGPERKEYRSAHWDEKNILAHVRFDERTDADGKRVLFIQEIQSDWHQTGRKRGYKAGGSNAAALAAIKALEEKMQPISDRIRQNGDDYVTGKITKQRHDEINVRLHSELKPWRDQRDEVRRQMDSAVPDAPFKTTWPDLAFKRMVRWAAEHGFDRIAWNTGDMANEMLSIEDKVHHIDYKTKDGLYRLGIILQNSEEFGTEKEWMTADEVEELLGADIARKIVNGEGQPGGDRKTLRGLDLKLGGAGNRGFYDKILPQMAAKIGKKWGAKVGQTTLELPGELNSADTAQYDTEVRGVNRAKVHSMDVTAAMRDAAMAGQPLFSRRWSAGATGRGQAIRNGRRTFDLQDYGPWSSWWNYVVYQMQNKFYDLFRTQKELAAYRNMVNLPEKEDANMHQTLYHGRAEERAGEFWETFVEDKKHPGRRTLVKMMREADKIGFGWAEVENWLYARHAKEANAQLLKVNDGDPTFNSGMSDVEADAILNSFVHPILDEIGAHVDAMTKWTRNNLVSNGIESQDTIDAWEKTYKHYVPLKGWRDDPDVETMPRTGKGFDTGGNAKRRTGRTSRGDAVLANVVGAAQASIIRAEKAKVGRALYEMVKNTDAPNLWHVDQVEYTRYVDPRDGLVRQVVNPNFVLAPNVVRVRINGEDFHITFNPQNESMARLAAAFKNLSNNDIGRFLATLHGINRFLSTMNTTLTPEFVITNALRDVQTAMVAIGMTDAAGLRTRVLANWKGAVRGIWNAERGDGAHPWAATWKEFKLEGGKVGWLQHYESAVDLEKALQGLVEPDGTIKMLAKGMGVALKLVEDANMSVENGIRLATYKAAVDSGISKAKAAEIAKNLTVNFNRKGNIGTAMNAWYLFYNAAVQGSSVVWGAVKHPKTRKIIYGITAAGIAMDIIMRMIGGEGDDKEREYDKIPEYTKESNMILMLPEGMRFTMPSGERVSFLKVPLPYGFNTFYYTGTKIGGIVDHLLLGNKRVVKPMEDAALVGMAFFNAFSPIGGQSGSFAQAVAPTALDPVLQVMENKSFSGSPLMPESNPFDNPPPDSERYFKSATQMARDMAHWLNEQTGGSEISPGRIDISPETIDHFWDFALGGLGRFVSGVGSTVHDIVVKPEDLELKEVPFIRRIAGEIGDRFTQDKFYEHVAEIGYANDEMNKALDMKRKSAEFLEQQAYTVDRYPIAYEMIDDLRSTTRVIKKARKEVKRLESREGSMSEEKRAERMKREKEFIQKEMNDFNRRWNEVEDSKLGERQKGRDLSGSVGPLVNGKSKRDAVASLRNAGMPAMAALLWELPMDPPKAIGEWFQRDSSRA